MCRAHLPLVLAAVIAACASGRTIALQASKAVPAASGKVDVRTGENDNRIVKVTVDHLAPPERLTPPGSVYVVWTQALGDGARPTNVGALHVRKDLTGELDTTTPLRAFRVIVTAEPGPTVEAPSGAPVLTAEITE